MLGADLDDVRAARPRQGVAVLEGVLEAALRVAFGDAERADGAVEKGDARPERVLRVDRKVRSATAVAEAELVHQVGRKDVRFGERSLLRRGGNDGAESGERAD